jgi:methyltransferase (TIGR00027 family)
VFGGKVHVKWPDNRQPEWAEAEWIRAFGYSHHDLGESEQFYVGDACPFGPNFWVRKEVFAAVPGYDEELGPRPSKRLIGGETEFLMRLRSRGFQALYAPSVKVTHRIAPHECRLPALRRRAYAFGRGQVRLHGCRRQGLYRRNRWLWASMMPVDYLYTSLRLMTGFMRRTPHLRCEATVQAMVRLGSLNASMALFRKTLAPSARLPNLSSSLNVGRLRYIQSLHEPPSRRNPDTLVKRFFPLGERVRLRFLPRKDLAVLRSDPFYYYLVARTRHYDKVFCEAIADGVQQILNVGCGTDTRSYRFQELIRAKKVSVMECDQRDAISVKEQLAKAWNRLARIEYSAIDLNGGDWSSVGRWLRASPGGKALVIMEGVSPYVSEDAFGRFLDFLAGTLPAGSQLAYDFKCRGIADGYGQGGATIRPFRLPATRDDVAAFHKGHGFQLDTFDSSADLSRRLLPGIDAGPLFQEDGLVRLLANRATAANLT